MSQSIIVGAVEIGTAKTLTAIGKIEIGRGLNIIGMGESVSCGMKKGDVIDFEAASSAAHSTLVAAEEKFRCCHLKDVYLSQTGAL